MDTVVESSDKAVRTPGFQAAMIRLYNDVLEHFPQTQPWTEFIDPAKFSQPESFSHAISRIDNNCRYFKGNYLILLALVVSILCPSLLPILFIASLNYLDDDDDDDDAVDFLIDVLAMSVTVLAAFYAACFISNKVVRAFHIGLLYCCVHAVYYRVPVHHHDDLLLDDDDQDFVHVGATKSAASPAPASSVDA